MLGGPMNRWGVSSSWKEKPTPSYSVRKSGSPRLSPCKARCCWPWCWWVLLAQWNLLGPRFSLSSVPGPQSSSCQECVPEGGLSRVWDSRIPHSFLGMEMATPGRFPGQCQELPLKHVQPLLILHWFRWCHHRSNISIEDGPKLTHLDYSGHFGKWVEREWGQWIIELLFLRSLKQRAGCGSSWWVNDE